MIHLFEIERTRPSITRKIPQLPRVGVVVDIFGRRIAFRQAPVLETLVNLVERGPTLANWRAIAREQLQEIKMPPPIKRFTVTVKAKTIARNKK